MQERTTRLRSQPSKRSGSRSVGRFRQARMKPSWTASRASSWSRRISLAAASSRATNARASTAKASRSPRCARSTSSRWSTATLFVTARPSMSRLEC